MRDVCGLDVFVSRPQVTYGKGTLVFTAQNCRVTVDHVEIVCFTEPGVGRNLLWTVRLEGQSSVPEPGLPSPTSSYLRPVITALRPALRGVDPALDYTTAGGTSKARCRCTAA